MTALDSQRSGTQLLTEHQRLATSGARAVLPFHCGGQLRLAVPQLAVDIPGTPPYMNGGDSNIDMLLYRWSGGRFIEDGRLPVPGGEDAFAFQIDHVEFLATASIRTGAGPYDLNADSILYRRTRDGWDVFQRFPTFAAKQWHYFAIGDRHFLALAQGVTIEGPLARNPRRSCIFEWNGNRFVEFQTCDGAWGYNWVHFELDGQHFLGYADHTSASGLATWNGASFTPFQEFAPQGGRAMKFFRADGQAWLAFANLTGESFLYRWHADRFVVHQSLGGPGAREFAVAQTNSALYVVKVNFIHGTPAAPKTDLMSCIYQWQQGQLIMVEEFPTFGAVDTAVFTADGQTFVAVANSLSRDIRFREDSVVYRLNA
jgi:EPTP domain